MRQLTGEERRVYMRECLEARREVVARAVSFERACQAAKDSNTRDAEDSMTRALDALGTVTRKYMRLLKKRR